MARHRPTPNGASCAASIATSRYLNLADQMPPRPRRLDRNIALLESLGPDATVAQYLAAALAIELRRR